MDRLKETFDRLVDWYMDSIEMPMFQMAQGILLGLMIAAGITLIVMGFRRENLLHKDGTENVQKEGESDDRT